MKEDSLFQKDIRDEVQVDVSDDYDVRRRICILLGLVCIIASNFLLELLFFMARQVS